MIGEYLRPTSVDEALELLEDKERNLKPLGGGTRISRQKGSNFGVVDLQHAGIDLIEKRGHRRIVGAAAKLHALLDHTDVLPEVKRAILIDASENIRNMATLGGWLVTSSGRSILTTLLLALDSSLTWEPGEEKVRLGNWLPLRYQEPPGLLMTSVEWGLQPKIAFEYVARSPKDLPIVVATAAQWENGRTRVALGGYGNAPVIAMDGPDDSGVDVASKDAYHDAGDQWATAEYRREVAAKLALRCLDRIDELKESEA
mgnify:CR=1 FL=1